MDLLQQALKSNDPHVLKLAVKLAENPLYNFHPRPDQAHLLDQQTSFYQDKFPGIAVGLGGTGSGKSFCGAAKVARFLAETPPPEKNTLFWVLSKNMEMSSGVCWSQNLSKFIPEKYIRDIVWYSAAKGMPRAVVLKPHANGNNYAVEFKSYDQGRQALQAANIAGFWCDEQVTAFDLLIEVIGRTRKWANPGSRIFTLTPVEPDPKLEEIASEPDKWPDWKFYRFNTRLNDAINPDFVRQLEANEIAELIETRLTGAFAVFEGAIFKEFNQKVHVIDPFDIPKNWTVYRGIDLGFSHCTACVWVAKDLEGHNYVFREYNKAQTNVEAHVKSINDDWDAWPNKGGTWIDPANAQVVHEMELKGLRCQNADKEVKSGIGTLQSMLRPGPDGLPKLRIFRNCENLVRQIRTYVWDSDKLDTPKKETPTNLRDCLDALRYAVHSANKTTIQYKPLPQPQPRKINF